MKTAQELPTKHVRILDPIRGSWIVQVQVGGKRHTRKGASGGEKAALAAYEKVMRVAIGAKERKEAARTLGVELADENEASLSRKGLLSFKDFFEQHYFPWAQSPDGLDPATLASRVSTHAHVLRLLGNTALADIDELKIEEFKRKRRKEGVIFPEVDKLGRPLLRKPRPITTAGLFNQMKILRAILNWAKRMGFIERMPVFQMPSEKRATPGAAKQVRYFTDEELARLLRWTRKNHALGDVIRFGVLTGMRPAEIWHMRVGSIDLKRGVMRVEEQQCPLCPNGRWLPKVGIWRQVEIANELLPIVERYCKGKHENDLLFENRHGAPYSRQRGGSGSFVKLLRRAGLDRRGLSFYSLRHTFAAKLASLGAPLQAIGQQMGHSDVRTTQRYAHLMPGALTGVVHALTIGDEWKPIVVDGEAKPSNPETNPQQKPALKIVR
jgi:integrase